ncbi:MAG TPA: bifunctional diguanylate cyclase/phosphodiesterase [Oleiagrimonas sp.]|nr:bifunctional diguanylate cyclase/phosphodiesterase [Oleiagrimonas sp.]
MSASPNPTGILLVTSRREDRRQLFDVLDGHGYAHLHAARDVAQARALLADKPPLDLVLLEFVDEARDAFAFCAHLRRMAAYRGLVVIGLLTRGADRQAWADRHPTEVAAWLCAPVDTGEALRTVQGVLARPPREPVPVPAPVDHVAADYRFAFDDDDRGWIVSTPEGRVLEVNRAFARRKGASAETLRERRLAQLLGEDAAATRALRECVDAGGRFERVVQLADADDGTGQACAVTRATMHGGDAVHVTTVQNNDHVAHARNMLELLAHLHQAGVGDAGVREAARMLARALPLDFLGVYAAMPESNGEIVAWVQERRQPLANDDPVPDVLRQPALKLVLGGEILMHCDDASRLAGSDEFVAAMGFAAFAGLPLVDERSNVLGALLAGSREPWQSQSLVPETLRAATMHFARDMELERARDQGRAHGLLDGLTNLPNRLLFNDRLDTTLREARRTGEMFAVLFVDLDRFKSINDSLGHSVGDEVLAAVSRRLRGSVRSSDTVARYAGDEFIIILRHITQREDVLRIAEKIVRLMDAPLMLEAGSELHITASIGISFYPDDAATAESLLKHADVAMYNAKGKGRNGYQVYVAMPEKSHQQRVALESKLRQAEKNGELRVYYQPQVDACSEDIVGMEALVRWEHPELGMISPAFFIPIAEETGLIIPIGEWVLRRACADCVRWQQRFKLPLRVGVNLSALQLMQPNLVDVVRAACAESGLNPKLLDLEVTESISMKSVPNLLDTLSALRGLGCGISIDDFGTGQSSLDYIKRFPADRIKIDQSFVRNIGMDPGDEAIVRATLEMAHTLGRKVVAEGVETEQHHAFLRELGCDELQGYLFCRPLSPVSFDNMLAERARAFAAGTDPTNLLAELEALS